MSVMFEVYYRTPFDEVRNTRISEELKLFRGELTYHEESDSTVCLTFEFPSRSLAEDASEHLRGMNEYVEEVQDY